MSGVQDPSQAMSSATSFVQGKGFHSGYKIVVIGELGQVGSISGIIMTNAVAPPVTAPAPTPAPAAMAMAAEVPSVKAASVSRAERKKPATKKKKGAQPKKRAAAKKAKTRTKRSPKIKPARKNNKRRK